MYMELAQTFQVIKEFQVWALQFLSTYIESLYHKHDWFIAKTLLFIKISNNSIIIFNYVNLW